LNITVSDEAGAGEEAIGILSFMLKISLRMVPVGFGVGAIGGIGAATYFFLLLSKDEIFALTFPVVGEMSILEVTIRVLGLGLLPLLAYLAFVVLHLVIDLVRAVLSVPLRLEGFRQAVRPG
jgi:hypothetical protein